MKPTPFEPCLNFDQPIVYMPSSGTDVAGRGLGPDWTRDGGSGTVSHPAPGATFATQFRRTRITSTAASNNELGVRLPIGVAWRGDAQSRGGFYFHARFMVNAMPNSAVRLFVGLSAQTSAGVCVAGFGSMPANTMGLWCDSGEVGVLGFVTSDSVGGKTKSALTNSEILTAGRLYEFIMIANPNQGVVVTQLTDVEAGVINSQNFSSTMPLNTAFMGPQVALSNASNAGGGDTAFDVYSCYLRPNLRLTPSGAP